MKLLWYLRLFLQFTRVMGLRYAVRDAWSAWRFSNDPEEAWEYYRLAGYTPQGAWLESLD